MKIVRVIFTVCVFVALVAGAAILVLRPEWIKPSSAEEAEKEPETEVPVHVAAVKRMTLHRWVEGAGYVEPEPASKGRPAAAANVAAPVATTVAEVHCELGKVVEAGELLFQLDDRLARAAEEQAKAAMDSAKATLAKLKSTPRPEQLALAQLAVDKAREGLAFARKVLDRQNLLSKTESVPAKTLEVAAHDVEVAQNDVSVAEKQLVLLKASPTPEELAEASGKVVEAERAVASSSAQRSMLRVQAPLKGTVVRVLAAAGEAVDPTKPLAELVALDRLVVNVSVPAEQMSQLHAGQSAEVITDVAEEHEAENAEPEKGALEKSAPEKAAPVKVAAEKNEVAAPAKPQAAVHSVGFAVDRRNNSAPVVVSLPADAGFRPGQFLRVRILAEEHEGVLAVPWASVVKEEDKFAIAVVHDEKATRIGVTLGLREGDWVEVAAKDLKGGDTVVTEGAYGLPKETKVHVVEDAKEEKKDAKSPADEKTAKDEKK